MFSFCSQQLRIFLMNHIILPLAASSPAAAYVLLITSDAWKQDVSNHQAIAQFSVPLNLSRLSCSHEASVCLYSSPSPVAQPLLTASRGVRCPPCVRKVPVLALSAVHEFSVQCRGLCFGMLLIFAT